MQSAKNLLMRRNSAVGGKLCSFFWPAVKDSFSAEEKVNKVRMKQMWHLEQVANSETAQTVRVFRLRINVELISSD